MNVKHCSMCPFFSCQLARVITHVRRVHSAEPNFNVYCGIEGCANKYTNFNSYRSHLYRHHRNLLEENSRILQQRRAEQPAVGGNSDVQNREQFPQAMDCADGSANVFSERPSADDLSSEHTTVPVDRFECFLKQAKSTIWNFYFCVTEKHCLPPKAAVSVFAELQVMFELVLKAYSDEIAHAMKASATTSDVKRLLDCSFVPELFRGLDSKHKRDEYAMKTFPFISPEEQHLGQEARYHYIPLPKLLTAVCEIPDIAAHLTTPDIVNHAPSVYRDYSDGLVYREHLRALIPEGSTHTIITFFYTDEIEVVNPLGAKRGKQKLLAVYCVLLNLHTKHRSQLDNIYLVMLVRYAHVKTHGLDKVLQPMLDDLKQMYKDGLTIRIGGEEICATVVVLAFCGYSLSLNRLGGFSCFSKGQVCRYCMVSVNHLAEKTSETMCQARTLNRHQLHLQAVTVDADNKRLYGGNDVSPLLQLQYFDVTRQLPPDVMHDILEGGGECVLRHVLNSLISSNLLSEKDLEAVSSFDYGPNDAKDRPPPLNVEFLTNNSVLVGTASNKWCLFRFLPLIFGSKIPEGNEDWEMLLKFREILDITLASEFSSARLSYLDVIVQTFLIEFAGRYGSLAVIPKLHYMVHYARFVREVGPLRQFWSMRFEAKRQNIRKLARTVRNFRNLTHTLANRHQLRQCYQLHTFQLYQGLQTVGSKPVDWNTLPSCAKEALPMSVCEVKSATLDHCSYRCGSVLVATTGEGPEFHMIESLLVASGKLYLLTRTLLVECFDRHKYCYCIRRSSDQKICQPDDKFEHYLLDLYEGSKLVPRWKTW
ncbi:uncharacterized protein LOC125943886 [Dermacentor silvarum]|uniref:uncharacterized protein LOC125943886 n=1 Tax=Dermacentor silvarum TaxID=543639 RepID=UPI0021012F9D|nr:uncharacterized protein LOC125943886 [Dermacentor silvarum]